MSRFLKHIFIAGFIGLCSRSHGQQHASVSQYMFNGLSINPAYAGSQEALTTSFLSRFQNVGLPGAPNTQTFSIHSPIAQRKIALGMMVIHDKIGVIDQTGVTGIYAYRIPVAHNATLTFGLQVGFGAYRARYTSLDTYQSDPLFSQDIRQARPNFGAGIYYSQSLWYLGVSMPHMMNNVFQRGPDFQTVYQNIPVIVSGGYVFDIHPMFKLKPNFLFKAVDNRAVELDLNANLLFDEVVWVGLSYKFNNATTLLMELQATEQLRLGYSYSITMGPIRKAELGSHELLLQYRFKFNMKGIVTPRYF